MEYLICLFFVFINILLSRTLSKKLLFPSTLFSTIWFIVILIHFICSEYSYLGLRNLSLDSIIVFTLGSCCFTFGSIVSSFFFRRKQQLNDVYQIVYKVKFERIILLMAIVFFPLYAYESYIIATNNPISGNWFMDLRLNINSGEYDRQFVYGIIFANFAFFIYLYKFYSEESINRRLLYLTGFVLFLYVVLSTGRTAVMQMLLMILGVISVYKRIKMKNILYAFFGFVLLFFAYGVALNKGGSEDNSLSENISSLSENFVMYCVGSLSAFDHAYTNGIANGGGEVTFRVVNLLLYRLGLNDTPPLQLVEDFVHVPFRTNVYTCYYLYIRDFGIWYAMLVIFIQSFLHTMFYFKAIQGGRYQFQFTFLYSMFLFPLIMSFFHDQFILLIPNWIYIGMLVLASKKFIFSIRLQT